MWVDEETALRQHVGVKIVVGNLVQNCALRATAHAVQAQPGQCSAPLRFANARLEAYLKAKCVIVTWEQTGSSAKTATKKRSVQPVRTLTTVHQFTYGVVG